MMCLIYAIKINDCPMTYNLGTGKSETGAHIAFTFAMTNRQLGSPKKCVLYCGPSNKSVDVVLGKRSITNMLHNYSLKTYIA